MNKFLFWSLVIGIPLILFIIWKLYFRNYMYSVTNIYNKNYLNLDKITVDDEIQINKLMKLYFNRQQAYELRAHMTLIIAILLLIVGICLFLFSVELVIGSGICPGEPDFALTMISLRTGITIITFFICQVLLKLYRYLLKFSLFYMGLFDALFIHRELKISIKKAVDIFKSDIDFGDSPSTLIKDAVDLVVGVNKVKSGTP